MKITPAQREWTVLIYQGNGLFAKFDEHQMDLAELSELPITDRVTFVTQGHIDYQDDVLVRREVVGCNATLGREVGRVQHARQNQPEQLADFVQWGMKAYPAKRYCLVISGHGGGWNGLVSDKRKGLVQLPALAENLEKGLKGSGRTLDVLAIDAHWMACGEVVSEFSKCADFLVASQGRINSWKYSQSFAPLVRNPEQTGLGLTHELVHADLSGSRMTGVDLGQADQLVAAVRGFATAIEGQVWQKSPFGEGVREAHFYDLGLVGRAFQSEGFPEPLRAKACELAASVRAAVVEQQVVGDEKPPGLNVADMSNEQTSAQRMHKESGWAETVHQLWAAS